jgi:hypothetical protein
MFTLLAVHCRVHINAPSTKVSSYNLFQPLKDSAPIVLVEQQYSRFKPLSTNPRLCENKIIHTPVPLLTQLNMSKIKTLQVEYNFSTM